MSYLDWKVGDKVVCIDDGWTVKISVGGVEANIPNRLPMIGEVLTIADIEAGCGELGTGRADGVFLAFEEIQLHQSDEHVGFDVRWDAGHFRKVQPRKTSIAVFEAILNGHRVPEDA